MSKSTKNYLLVSDPNCASAIAYKTSCLASGLLRDSDGVFHMAFEYSDELEQAIEDYEFGELAISAFGFIQAHEFFISDYNQATNDFNNCLNSNSAKD